VLMVAALLASSVACFSKVEQNSHQTSEDVRHEIAPRETTNTTMKRQPGVFARSCDGVQAEPGCYHRRARKLAF
jgi:hypothetical protein